MAKLKNLPGDPIVKRPLCKKHGNKSRLADHYILDHPNTPDSEIDDAILHQEFMDMFN
jgi:hypothetical protein